MNQNMAVQDGPLDQHAETCTSRQGMTPTTAADPKSRTTPTLRYRKTPAFLLALYLPTLIVPWVLICVMTKKPLGSSSYRDQTGDVYLNDLVGVLAVQLIKTINAVAAVPTISALLAYAAVVYVTRRKIGQSLNLQQLFALADRGWTNIPLLLSARSRGKSSAFLWYGALLIALGAILQPLTSALVTFKPVPALTCVDLPVGGCHELFGPATIGNDPEPADMPFLLRDNVLQDVMHNLVIASDLEPQQHLWPNNPVLSDWIDGYTEPPNRQIFATYSPDFGHNQEGFFTSALPNGTDTGVLRQHALRLNSSVSCQVIPRSDFPESCPGVLPFEVRINKAGHDLKICAPGHRNEFPFTPSRHRQDITEELYIDLQIDREVAFDGQSDNFTTRCTSATSRGYFEIGNVWNDHVYGPLLDKWPTAEELEKDFHDYRQNDAFAFVHPTEEDEPTDEGRLEFQANSITPFYDPGPYRNESTQVPGPLMVSAQALFGNYSLLRFFSDNTTSMTPLQAYSGICEHGNVPFGGINFLDIYGIGGIDSHCHDAAGRISGRLDFENGDPSEDSWDWGNNMDLVLSRILSSHVRIFNSTEGADYALMISQYFANKAVLMKTMVGEGPFNVRPIYHSPGGVNVRAEMATASLVVLTILVALQTAGLALVAWFIYSVPTWTDSLDATRVAQVGNALPSNSLPRLGLVSAEDEKRLREMDGVVGLEEDRAEPAESEHEVHTGEEDENAGGLAKNEKSVDLVQGRLAVGGQGLVTSKT